MSNLFICTSEKEWYLKINTIEQLLEYWNNVLNPTLEQAYKTIQNTREFGCGMNHCDYIQSAIGVMANAEHLTYKKAYEKLLFDTRIMQYQTVSTGTAIYINKKMGWNAVPKNTEQFVYRNTFDFPIMKKDHITIEQFPMGKHYYVFIDGVQLRKDENLKFNSYEEALTYAQSYVN